MPLKYLESVAFWKDERNDALLRKLWADGLSASQVAAELGAGITRNAVIGKIHRLGLAERAKTASAPRPRVAKAPRVSQPRVGGGVHGNLALAFAPHVHVAPRALEEEVVIPMSEHVTLMELREGMCKWPIGDPKEPGFAFCGAGLPANSPSPYCVGHTRIARVSNAERRTRRAAMKKTRVHYSWGTR